MKEQTELILKELRKLNDLCSRFAALADVLTHGFEPEPIYEWIWLMRSRDGQCWEKTPGYGYNTETEIGNEPVGYYEYKKIDFTKRERK